MKPFAIFNWIMGSISNIVGACLAVQGVLTTHYSPWWDVALLVFASGIVTSCISAYLGAFSLPARAAAAGRSSAAPGAPADPLATAPISIVTVRVQDGSGGTTPLKWPMKVWVVMHNDAGDPIDVGPVSWAANLRGGRLHQHPTDGLGYQYSVEQPGGGAARGSWGPEQKQLTVPAGATFRIWVGLDATHDREALERLTDARQLGTLIVPVTAGGVRREVRAEV